MNYKLLFSIVLASTIFLILTIFFIYQNSHKPHKDALQIISLTDTDKKNIVEHLQKAFADEWLAYYQYWIGAKVVTGKNIAEVKKELTEHANDELRHADMLAERILEYGDSMLLNPKDWFTQTVCGFIEPKDSSVKVILQQNLESELCAVKVYKEFAQITKDKDPETYRIVLQILADEEHHVKDLNKLLQEYAD